MSKLSVSFLRSAIVVFGLVGFVVSCVIISRKLPEQTFQYELNYIFKPETNADDFLVNKLGEQRWFNQYFNWALKKFKINESYVVRIQTEFPWPKCQTTYAFGIVKARISGGRSANAKVFREILDYEFAEIFARELRVCREILKGPFKTNFKTLPEDENIKFKNTDFKFDPDSLNNVCYFEGSRLVLETNQTPRKALSRFASLTADPVVNELFYRSETLFVLAGIVWSTLTAFLFFFVGTSKSDPKRH